MEENTNIASAIDKAYQLGAEAAIAKAKTPIVREFNGRNYFFKENSYTPWEPIPDFEEKEYFPPVFEAATLTGLISWIKADTDGFFAPGNPAALVTVEDPTTVAVYSHCQGREKRRIKLAKTVYEPPEFKYGAYVDAEMLAVKIQTCFIKDDGRDAVLYVVSNMTEEQTTQTADDGISQRVTVKSGVQAVNSTIFRNPAYLRPMRTFTEVTQPESPFVVRFKEGGLAALHEADGGKWKTEAIRSIGAFLAEMLAGCNVVVIA